MKAPAHTHTFLSLLANVCFEQSKCRLLGETETEPLRVAGAARGTPEPVLIVPALGSPK